MKTIIIQNARLIDPANSVDKKADILICKGKISAIEAPNSQQQNQATIIDARHLIVSPGLVDCCARLREPGQENKATILSETIAAAKSGITTLCCPPDTNPVIDEPSVVEFIHRKATDSTHCKVVTLGALTANLAGKQLSEAYALQQAGCVGLSNARQPLASVATLKNALAYAATVGITVFIEPEEYSLSLGGCAHEGKIASRLGLKGIPIASETIAIAIALQLIRETGAKVHFGRLSAAQSVKLIAQAKAEKLPVSADVSAHQLHLNEQDVSSFNSAYHLIPPLRSQRDQEALLQGVADGTIDAICSDHQPHSLDAKQAPFASTEAGMTSFETFLPLCLRLSERTSLNLSAIIAKITQAPATILGIKAGNLALGANADICIFDNNQDWQLTESAINSQGKNTPFLGWRFQTKVKQTLVNGKLVYNDNSSDNSNNNS